MPSFNYFAGRAHSYYARVLFPEMIVNMTSTKPSAQFIFDKENQCYVCEGPWTVLKLNNLINEINLETLPGPKKIPISGKALTKFDSSGALALMHCVDLLKSKGFDIELVNYLIYNSNRVSLRDQLFQGRWNCKDLLLIIGLENCLPNCHI